MSVNTKHHTNWPQKISWFVSLHLFPPPPPLALSLSLCHRTAFNSRLILSPLNSPSRLSISLPSPLATLCLLSFSLCRRRSHLPLFTQQVAKCLCALTSLTRSSSLAVTSRVPKARWLTTRLWPSLADVRSLTYRPFHLYQYLWLAFWHR
jgi:hypothetical protein